MPLTRELHLLLEAAWISFKRNKIRTTLTSLGITIGVLSVVMLIALGLGLKNYMHEQFESLGTNLIAIMPGGSFSEEGGLQGMGASMMAGIKFTLGDVESLNQIDILEYVVPFYYKLSPVTYKTDVKMGYVMGATPDVFDLLNLKLDSGDYFYMSHTRKRSQVALLGFSLAQKYSADPERLLGKTISVEGETFTVIGTLQKKGDIEMDSGVFMPYTTTFKELNPDKEFLTIYAGVADKDNIAQAKKEIETALLKEYDEDDFSVVESSEILGAVNSIFNIINGVLVAIGSISLLVGGIGIMNIMYASVTERTKEIGIRRAIGATKQDILWQFLTESIVLSLFGGLLGLSLSALIVVLVHPYFPVALNGLSVSLAFGVSSAIGIFFGITPAKRAAALPPIEAIRYE